MLIEIYVPPSRYHNGYWMARNNLKGGKRMMEQQTDRQADYDARQAQYEHLKEQAKKTCVVCNSKPRIANLEGMYTLRCNCYPQAPSLGDVPSANAVEAANLNMAAAMSANEELSRESLRQLCPEADDRELYVFGRMCVALGANPFLGEAHLIKYAKDKPAQFVPGYQIYLKRAARYVAFAGFASGVVVERDDGLHDLDGSLIGSKDVLVGGWCTVRRRDYDAPITERVSFKEFDRGQSQWKERPAYMIEKVAISHAFRRAFPDEATEVDSQMALLNEDNAVDINAEA